MLYICIFSNKFDLNQTTRVSHTTIIPAISLSVKISVSMDKLLLTWLNLGHVFNSRRAYIHAMHSLCNIAKLKNLVLKPQHHQLLGYLSLISYSTLPPTLFRINESHYLTSLLILYVCLCLLSFYLYL